MDRKELLVAYTKRLWMANTANDITGLLLDYEKDLKLIEEKEQVKNCSIPNVGKRIFIVFAERKDPLNEAREIVKVFTKESEAVIWIAENNSKKYYYEAHKVG